MGEKIRVVLADDHALVLNGLRSLLEQIPDFEVVATAQDGNALLDVLEHYQVDVVVLDLQMPYHGLKALAEIRKRNLPVHVLVLTAFADGDSIQSALELQAEGYALKTESPMQTVEAIRQVAQGRLVFPRAAQKWLFSRPATSETGDLLSLREVEIMRYMAQGLTNSEIAEKLVISANTVRFHLKNIFEKLQVTNRTEAAAWYFKHYQDQK
jgi:DNA-binding NarL/FixJ family response regulator